MCCFVVKCVLDMIQKVFDFVERFHPAAALQPRCRPSSPAAFVWALLEHFQIENWSPETYPGTSRSN